MPRFLVLPIGTLVACLLAGAAPAQNLLTNGDFDTGVPPWTFGSQEFVEANYSLVDIDGSFASGSVEIWAQTGSAYQCVPVAGGSPYLLSGFVQPLSFGRAGGVEHSLEVEWFDTFDCSTFFGTGRDALVSPAALDVWHLVEGVVTAPASALSARVHLQHRMQPGGGIARALFDAVHLPEPAFASTAGAGALGLGLLAAARRRRGARPARAIT